VAEREGADELVGVGQIPEARQPGRDGAPPEPGERACRPHLKPGNNDQGENDPGDDGTGDGRERIRRNRPRMAVPHWSCRKLAAAQGLCNSRVQRIWSQARIIGSTN
jgi:hypothetical protein